jgi:hypothetical protein
LLKNKKKNAENSANAKFEKRVYQFSIQPLLELNYALKFGTLPWLKCLVPGILFNLVVIFRWDAWVFRHYRIQSFYPSSVWLYILYLLLGAFSGFWVWGIGQALLREKLIKKLSEAFASAGLRTPLGKMPSFIFDRPLDAMTRKLRLKRSYLSLKNFKDAKESLESSLQIYIDTFVENRIQGSVDVVYSHYPMDDIVTIGDEIHGLPRDTFIVGKSRSHEGRANLNKTPHFLVGGQTGGGKSTFLRQMIASLYLRNKDYEFRLIDLKGGLEFQIFEGMERIKVVPDVARAITLIRTFERSLKFRMETLKMNKCKDITAFFAMPSTERIYPEGQYREIISRTILVIDEVADIFMASTEVISKDVQEAKRIIWKVGAQGRAVGLHLIVATQRPDVKALDSQIKTHLVGVVCFPMVNDASSMTVLGNGRATDLPRIPGRAIWKSDLDMVEIQTPFITPDEVLKLIKKDEPQDEVKKGDQVETSFEKSGDSAAALSVEMESGNDHRTGTEVLSESETGERLQKTT